MKMKVVGGNLNVRRNPDINAEIMNVLADGDIIQTAPEENGWCAAGSGYVMAKWLEHVQDEELQPAEDESKELKEAAKEIKEAAKEIKKAAGTTKKTASKKAADTKK